MFCGKKINSDMLVLALLVVHLRLGTEISRNNRWNSEPESREVFLGSSSAYTQINFHTPYTNNRHYPSKSLEQSDLEDASILFSRLNYFSSFRHSSNNLIAYFSPGVQNVRSTVNENANSDNNVSDASSSNQSLPAGANRNTRADNLSSDENGSDPHQSQDLSPEDMDLIEILWKQDIDLGVTREAYDSNQNVEPEKLKEVEYSKESAIQEFLTHKDVKGYEENVTSCDPWAGQNYTVDSETGEHIVLDELYPEDVSRIPNNLLEDGIFEALSPNSYLSFDENAQFPNLTVSLSSGEFPELLPEDLTADTEFLASQIEDLEKVLSRYEANLDTGLENPEVQNELFPNMEDCWQDITTMLPLSVLGSTHQGSFATVLPRPLHMYHNSGANNTIPYSSTTPQISPSEGFTSMLLQNTTLPVPSSEENSTFHCMPSSIGPSSIGCAVAESMATLTNDTEPIPSTSIVNSMYNSDLPELLYPNQTAAAPHSEFSLSDLLLDEDFQLMDMAVPVDANHNIIPKTEDHMDTSSDSLSLTSGRVPSISDCQDWVDSCSESSSHQGDEDDVHRNMNSSFASNSDLSVNFNHRENSIHFNPDMIQASVPKKIRQFGDKNRDSGSRNFRDTTFETSRGKESQYFFVKSQFSGFSESSPCAMTEGAAASNEQFINFPKTSGGSCSNFIRHNHSYHIPFSNGNSLHKPVMRDKSKSISDEEANKDEKRANALKLPISISDIINLAIDEFNERLSKYELTEPQLTLIRDIRRRGKNKVAAQNCRKRKMDQISTLQQDLDVLQSDRLQLESEKNQLLRQRHHVQNKYAKLYQFVLQSTNSKPPDPPTCLPVLSTNELSIPSSSDTITSDEDCDLRRGARTKRKTKK